MGSGVVLTEKIERKVSKITAKSPPPMERISLKSHKFEKIPQEEKVRHIIEQYTNFIDLNLGRSPCKNASCPSKSSSTCPCRESTEGPGAPKAEQANPGEAEGRRGEAQSHEPAADQVLADDKLEASNVTDMYNLKWPIIAQYGLKCLIT